MRRSIVLVASVLIFSTTFSQVALAHDGSEHGYFRNLIENMVAAIEVALENVLTTLSNKPEVSIDKNSSKDIVSSYSSELLSIGSNLLKNPSNNHAKEQFSLIAAKRKVVLLDLIEKRTSDAFEVFLSSENKEILPNIDRSNLEEEVEIEGFIDVFHSDDFDNDKSEFYYFLNSKTNGRLSLHFAGKGPELMSGSEVRIKGFKLDDKLAARSPEDRPQDFEILEEVEPGHTVKKVAVILFNFIDNTGKPYTLDSARSITFTASNSVNAYFKQASLGNLSLEGKLRQDGDVFGWYTIPYSQTPCDYYTWASAANAAARSAGVDTTGYNHIVYGFPSTSACGWAGLGQLGGSLTWIKGGNFNTRVVGHELGHNLGVHHASSYSCTENGIRVPISSSCTKSEYGDPFDIMGNSLKHMSTFHKGRLNWYQTDNTNTVTQSGVYTIDMIEKPSTGIKALRIPKDVSSTGSITKYYYLEYRNPFGFDNFASTSNVSNGISIRIAPPYTSVTQTLLIDATPSTTSFGDPALTLNKSFTDSAKGITVKTIGIATSSATVEVVVTPTLLCGRNNPGTSISPSSQFGLAGESKTYNVTVTNKDTSTCPNSQFNIASVLPSGFSQTPSTFVTNPLPPGSSQTISINVTSGPLSGEQTYSFTETATNLSSISYKSSASASYSVYLPDSTPPAVSISSPSDGSNVSGRVQISASATDNRGVIKMELYLNGRLELSSNSSSISHKWNTSPKSISGPYVITIKAYDQAGNTASESVSVTVK